MGVYLIYLRFIPSRNSPQHTTLTQGLDNLGESERANLPIGFLDSDKLPVRAGSAAELNALHAAEYVLVTTLRVQYIDLATVTLF